MSLTLFVTTATIKKGGIIHVTTATIKKRKKNVCNNYNHKEKEEKYKKEDRTTKNSTALTGNRTRAPRVAGEDSTTEPSVHS